ncbi:hypothetical protein HPB49_015088 [Dermacentor silvarum]|uniref:Uncharacterized protein n=1 Tax=Dermacentor silvarum TaxID=543639 RepID=A0ACB8CFQ8_DERSI|nr:hypothetical protein HPB49_015088 [Dermacentor silvarum]
MPMLKPPTPFGSAASRMLSGEEDLEESASTGLCVFKPKQRSKRDEAWNPKAKLPPNCQKPPRPTQEGTHKSVKRTIEDTASKLANKPPPKRSHHRKKAKKPSLPPDAFRLKKPKKGFATAKQRLGKILKIHKMIY